MTRRAWISGSLMSFWGLSASILLTIWIFDLAYPLFLDLWNLPKSLGWPAERLARNVAVLMDYLTLPWINQLKFPDLPASESGLYHFQVVKYLFHFCQLVFVGTSLGIAFQKSWLWVPASWYRLWALIPLGLGFLAVLVGFDQFFIWFHQVLFPGDQTWLFDPRLDPIILLLPQDVFLLSFICWGILYELYFFFCFFATKKSGLS
ncbi:TIGR01906 family membrane protein [Streptococcus danieliae]|uniref:TIGR01906 family membrane protein n=1 Tax=Streptococcus danieliae TaxID=747656 RepID=A0A7X3G7S5_9STRE|nr:TIGR01906 family membrane protein [Streptococcus danieliae]MVX58713.1 TIGR01906 family membrane protein [Streptococcus danieliae]